MPFDAGMRKAIYDAASDGKTMTVKRIESVLQRDFFIAHPHVRGTSNPKAMSSKRSNYAYFCRLFDVKALSASDMSMAEDLVLWNTVFEDRDILRRKILKTYGDLLTEKAVDDFCHKRLSGWGKLSERLLTGIWADTASGDMCVMDVLEQGRPYGRYRGSSMNLMQILNDDVLGFKMEIKRLNDSHMQMAEGFDLNALPGSPALRRGVSQAMKVLDDIVSVAGKAPDRIYLKVTRTASNSRKGKRTAIVGCGREEVVLEAIRGLLRSGLHVTLRSGGVFCKILPLWLRFAYISMTDTARHLQKVSCGRARGLTEVASPRVCAVYLSRNGESGASWSWFRFLAASVAAAWRSVSPRGLWVCTRSSLCRRTSHSLTYLRNVGCVMPSFVAADLAEMSPFLYSL